MTSRCRGFVTVVLALLVGAVGIGANSPMIASTGPLLVVAASIERRRRDAQERSRGLARLLPVVVDDVIQQLRSGRSLARSCGLLLAAGRPGADGGASSSDQRRLAEAFAPMAEVLRERRTLVEAADALLQRSDPSLRLFAVTVQVLALNGGPAVPALQRLRHTLIGIVHGSEQARAQSSQSLASAGLMAAAPAVVAFLVASVSEDAARFYLYDPYGAACVFVAVALSWLGWWWMQRNVSSLERRIA